MRPPRLPLILVALTFALPAGPLRSQTPPATSSPPATPAPPSTPITPPGASRSPAESALNAPGATNFESNTLLSIIDKAFDTDSDAFNPEDGTLSWKGHTYNLGQMRVFRARFERYLAQPESIDNEVYAGTLKQIFDLLSTRGGEAGAENLRSAWQLLYRASEYPEDAGASLAVANQIFNAWRIRDERDALAITSIELARIRREQQQALTSSGDNMARQGYDVTTGAFSAAASTAAAARPEINAGNSASGTGNNNTPPPARSGHGTTSKSKNDEVPRGFDPVAQIFRARDLAETEAKIKSAEAGGILTGAQAKLQFQTALVNLFLQRRFQHCLIAASFYRHTFKATAQTLEVGKKEIQSFLPSSDFDVTVETLEFLAREAINDTEAAMQSVRANYADGQLVGALERLQETFFLGEYLPAVSQFEREKKQVLLNLYRQLDQARKLADLKDYAAVDKLVGEIGADAKDFRSAEVLSAIRSAQRMSSLAIQAARQALGAEQFDRAQENLQRAAALWPLNPDLETYTASISEKINLGTQAAQLFDDAIARSDWRRLYDQKAQLGMALLTDAARSQELSTIIERISRVEIYLTQARELVLQNNAFAAWEALEEASQLAPHDVPVNQRRAELAPRVATFIGRIDAARRHEAAGRHAAALTQYLAAQGLYPASSLARTGIERISVRLLDDLALPDQPARPANTNPPEAATSAR